jgi:hypothetical protein
MAFKKMTVVPTQLYQKLMKQDPDYDDHLKQQKDEILSWQLPPELRSRFYQDVVRNMALRKAEEDAKPLLVSTNRKSDLKETPEAMEEVNPIKSKEKIKKKGTRSSLKRTAAKDALIKQQVLFTTIPRPPVVKLSTPEDEVFRVKKPVKRLSLKTRPTIAKWQNLGSPPRTRARAKKNARQEGAGKNKRGGWIEFQ